MFRFINGEEGVSWGFVTEGWENRVVADRRQHSWYTIVLPLPGLAGSIRWGMHQTGIVNLLGAPFLLDSSYKAEGGVSDPAYVWAS